MRGWIGLVLGARLCVGAGALAAGPVAAEVAGAGEVAGDPPVAWVSEDPAARAIAENEGFCRDMGGTPGVGPELVERVDVDGDDRQDLLIDSAGLTCDGRRDLCGTGGCTQEIWLAEDTGLYRRLLTELIVRIELPAPGRVRLILDGGACGKSGAEICEEDYAVEGGALVPLP